MRKKPSLKSATAFGIKLGLTRTQATRLAKLKTPERIQDYINSIPINFEPDGDTCLTAGEALRQNRAHCIEGAFIAACALWMQEQKPLLMDLKAKGDDDHVVALFRQGKCWGAISKSNHVWLRWREPIYRSLRELAMSYFHEYVSGNARTLWSYSVPFDLRRFEPEVWISGRESCWDVAGTLDHIRHYSLINRGQIKRLRRSDPIEMRANQLLDFQPPKKRRVPKPRPRRKPKRS
ncbi:MAG: hypothetical protein SFW62_03085 [Alphaproteobacteria bacterium]|nr:hypothetical protein [Alphaproteobacteria bacterium]